MSYFCICTTMLFSGACRFAFAAVSVARGFFFFLRTHTFFIRTNLAASKNSEAREGSCSFQLPVYFLYQIRQSRKFVASKTSLCESNFAPFVFLCCMSKFGGNETQFYTSCIPPTISFWGQQRWEGILPPCPACVAVRIVQLSTV